MDSMVSTAARALALGDPLRALKHIALREDPPALALRGIAMAQLGELAHARKLLRRAAQRFRAREPLARARCITAQAEIALAAYDLGDTEAQLSEASRLLEAHGDLTNALFARLVSVRRLILLGQVAQAQASLSQLDLRHAPARLRAVAELAKADVALRQVRAAEARAALLDAQSAARAAQIPALIAEAERALSGLDAKVARLRDGASERLLTLDDVQALFRSRALVLDGCRRELSVGKTSVSLVTRPVLFTLLRALCLGPGHRLTRGRLIEEAFQARAPNDSHRARLRVEMGRLRKILAGVATIRATADGFALLPVAPVPLLVLLPIASDDASALASLLGTGASFSTSSLAAALGKSQRSVQRALVELEASGRVRAVGRGRARRWVMPSSAGFATTMLLLARGSLG